MSAPGRRRAALLLRVSTAEQSIENQRPALEQLAARRGLEVVQVVEEEVSTRKKRPKLEQLLDDARRGRIDAVIVWALDRLGRSMAGNITLVLELDRLGVAVLSHTESWLDTDTNNPVRSLLVGIFSWVAEQERNRLGERTRAGLDRVRAKGVQLGRPKTHVPLAAALALASEKKGLTAIAKILGVPRSTLGRALRAAQASAPLQAESTSDHAEDPS